MRVLNDTLDSASNAVDPTLVVDLHSAVRATKSNGPRPRSEALGMGCNQSLIEGRHTLIDHIPRLFLGLILVDLPRGTNRNPGAGRG